jgi:hypothetical protein
LGIHGTSQPRSIHSHSPCSRSERSPAQKSIAQH